MNRPLCYGSDRVTDSVEFYKLKRQAVNAGFQPPLDPLLVTFAPCRRHRLLKLAAELVAVWAAVAALASILIKTLF